LNNIWCHCLFQIDAVPAEARAAVMTSRNRASLHLPIEWHHWRRHRDLPVSHLPGIRVRVAAQPFSRTERVNEGASARAGPRALFLTSCCTRTFERNDAVVDAGCLSGKTQSLKVFGGVLESASAFSRDGAAPHVEARSRGKSLGHLDQREAMKGIETGPLDGHYPTPQADSMEFESSGAGRGQSDVPIMWG
jgi:hypothetical protein